MSNNTNTEVTDDQTTRRDSDDNLTEAERRIRVHQATAWLEWARCAGADDE